MVKTSHFFRKPKCFEFRASEYNVEIEHHVYFSSFKQKIIGFYMSCI